MSLACSPKLAVASIVVGPASTLLRAYVESIRHRDDTQWSHLELLPQESSRILCNRLQQAYHEAVDHPGQTRTLILFINRDAKATQQLAEALQQLSPECNFQTACVISSIDAHFGDPVLKRHETWIGDAIQSRCRRLVFLQPSWLVSTSSGLKRWTWLADGVSPHMRSAFVTRDRLFSVIDQECTKSNPPGTRRYVLLGANRRWRDVLQEQRSPRAVSIAARMARGLRILPLHTIARFAACFLPRLRKVHIETLVPRSADELLRLYHRHSHQEVQLAGYNNGVDHFGWRFPGKTVVKTIASGKLCRLHGKRFTVDAGVTLNTAKRMLGAHDQQFLVLPNYSYISMGTLFFVPVHGSGSDVSTLSDTIESAILYDPVQDRILKVRRGEEEFRRRMYNVQLPMLLLRLKLRTAPRTTYRMIQTRLENASAADILDSFADPQASNIEIRKHQAKDLFVDVNKYYIVNPASSARSLPASHASLEIPSDRVGRIWDRIEETPVLSRLFHWGVRTFAYHVELFMTRDEFVTFWEHHRELPLSKIQLRMIRGDHLPHSPIGDQDRISADLFMLRKHRDTFRAFISNKMPHVRNNPGKQSM